MLAEIKGTWWRPPAQEVLKQLRVGTRLILDPEPTNPHDSNAIRVCIDQDTLIRTLQSTSDTFENELLAVGWSSRALLGWQGFFHLGYIPREVNSHWLSALAGSPNHSATLTFSPEGKPLCKLSLAESAQ